MKIGLLAYHAACNFGATLQLLSTYMFLKKNGHQPIILNWVAKDLEELYKNSVPKAQYACQKKVRQSIWHETELVHNNEEIVRIIKEEELEAVIIGSDAVAQHHPFLERLTFPCRTIVGVQGTTSDTQYPNPFWATWLSDLSQPIPVALISVSNQDSAFRLIPRATRKAMDKSIACYSYVSVRDSWTQQMFAYLTGGKCIPPITPDPVFAFNQNAASLLPEKSELTKRHQLPEKYILLSFLPTAHPSVSQDWIDEFSVIAKTNGIECFLLPFSHNASFGRQPHTIDLPLSPLEWYALIKYSQGYVGNNMHPIVVSLHNNIPFFSFDNYGTPHLNGLYVNEASSKIKHILEAGGFAEQRTGLTSRWSKAPHPKEVFRKLQMFDHTKCLSFADSQLNCYNRMMTDVMKHIAP